MRVLIKRRLPLTQAFYGESFFLVDIRDIIFKAATLLVLLVRHAWLVLNI